MSYTEEEKWHTIVTGVCAVVAGGAWLYLLIGPVPGMSLSGDEGEMAMQMASGAWGVTEGFLLVIMWSAMMLAMMLPSATGILPLLSRVGHEKKRGSTTLWFAAGYFTIWSAFSVVAAALQLLLHNVGAMSETIHSANAAVGAAVLIFAGLYQFHPLKQSCLARCRRPLDFLMTSWRDGNSGAARMGLTYGLVCTGCCWALMLVLFVLGIMNLLVVAALSAVIVLEKMSRLGRQLSRVTGAVLIVGGLLSVLTACGGMRAGSVGEAPRQPEIFAPGVISDAREQWRLTFTPDGRTAYFAVSDQFFPITRKAAIYYSTLIDGKWSAPVIAPFSGQYSDIDPFVSRDGNRLYFTSIRPAPGSSRNDLDIWMVERLGSGWSEPIRLGEEVNSSDDELYASESADGTLYFASGPMAPRAGMHFDIFSARRSGSGFAPRERLNGVNTTPASADPNLQSAWEFNPEISADGRTLFFTSLRPGGFGLGDLYVSRRNGEGWSAPRNLGPTVNTASDEYHPTLSRDGRVLYFVRRASPVRGDFYFISTAALDSLR